MLQVTGGALKIGNGASAAERTVNMLKIGDGNYIQIGEREADDMLSFKANKYNFTNGNVGIGTSSPTANLHVYNSSATTLALTLQASEYRLQITVASCKGCFAPYAEVGDAVFRPLGSRHGLIFNIPNADPNSGGYIKFGDDANGGWFVISNNQTVRINGRVFAREINVQTNVWSDHVFNKDYRLRPITEIEEFIKTNHHLPDVPSEKDVRENGINVADMNAVLLQKVEELTLYIIEQQKRIENLESKIK